MQRRIVSFDLEAHDRLVARCARNARHGSTQAYLVVVGDHATDELLFARELMRAHVSHVCVLRVSAATDSGWQLLRQIAQSSVTTTAATSSAGSAEHHTVMLEGTYLHENTNMEAIEHAAEVAITYAMSG